VAKDENCDTGEVAAGDSDVGAQYQDKIAVVAAIYLHALTGKSVYSDFIGTRYTNLQPFQDTGFIRYGASQGDALLCYSQLSSANTAVKNAILQALKDDVSNTNVYGTNDSDLYRAFLDFDQYHWGSNQVRAHYGSANILSTMYTGNSGSMQAYRQRALNTLNYFHGVNPLSKVYLSNM